MNRLTPYIRTIALSFALSTAAVLVAPYSLWARVLDSPPPARVYEDEAGFDCATMGNKTCGSLLVEGRLSAKGAKPIQSITVRIMPEEVFWNQEGSVYLSSQSESSCVAWVDQAAVAGRKAAGRDVLQAAFDECGKTFE